MSEAMKREPQPGAKRGRCGAFGSCAPAILTLVAALAGAAAPAAAQFGGGSVSIEGRVDTERGQIVSGARVHVESEEGAGIFETGVGPTGRFEVDGLRHIVYRVIVTADGYETYQESVDLSRAGFRFNVDITLSPKKTGPPEPPPSLSDTTAPRAARKEYERGAKALAGGKESAARAHFAKAVEDYPCYARAQTALALFFIKERDVGRAEGALKKSIECDAGFESAYLKLGELYNLERKFTEGVAVLEEGVRRDPGLWAFHYQLGTALYGARNYKQAEEEYVRSESLVPPAPPDVHARLANVYLKEAAYSKAYAEMQAYLRADPNGPFAPQVRSAMEQMRAAARTAPAGSHVAASAAPLKP